MKTFWIALAVVTSLAAATTTWRIYARQNAALVRVGGKTNACACTQRIEP